MQHTTATNTRILTLTWVLGTWTLTGCASPSVPATTTVDRGAPTQGASTAYVIPTVAPLSPEQQPPLHTKQRYSMKDLETLVSSQGFAEAVIHLKDIAPTQRDATWRKVVTSSVFGYAEKALAGQCSGEWRNLKDVSNEFSFLGNDAAWKKKLAAVGVCTIKEGKFSDAQKRKKRVDEILKLDSDAIYALVVTAKYGDYSKRFVRYIASHGDKFKKNERVRACLSEGFLAYRKPADDGARQIELALLRDFGLLDAIAKTTRAELTRFAAEMSVGDAISEADGTRAVALLAEMGRPDPALAAQFYLATFMVALRTHERTLPELKKLSRTDLDKAQKALALAKPSDPFWFSEPGWNSKETIKLVSTYAPRLAKLAAKECKTYRQDSSRKPAHVKTSHCRQPRAELAQVVAEMNVGNFRHDFVGARAIARLAERGQPAPALAAQYYLANFIVALNTHDRTLPELKKLSRADLKKAQKALASAQPSTPFWFSGSGWNSPEVVKHVTKYAPSLAKLAAKECERYQKVPSKEPVHVNTFSCPQLSLFLGIDKP